MQRDPVEKVQGVGVTHPLELRPQMNDVTAVAQRVQTGNRFPARSARSAAAGISPAGGQQPWSENRRMTEGHDQSSQARGPIQTT